VGIKQSKVQRQKTQQNKRYRRRTIGHRYGWVGPLST